MSLVFNNVPSFHTKKELNCKKHNIDIVPDKEYEEENYYMLRRRINYLLDKKTKEELFNSTLHLLNKIFRTKYKRLLDIRNISHNQIPKRKKLIKILKGFNNIEIDYEMCFNKNIPRYVIINNILNKINFSFICFCMDEKICYSVKAYKTTYII